MQNLTKNIEERLETLVSQLNDLEEAKEDLTEEEYNEEKSSTLE